MTTVKEVEDNIVLHLETEITDPIARTVGGFVNHGRSHYKSKTPLIVVRRGGERGPSFNGVGESKQDYDMRFEIVIEVAASVTGTVSGTQYSGSALANMVSDAVSTAMESSITGVKQIKRESIGSYMYSDVHYYVHIYNVYVVND